MLLRYLSGMHKNTFLLTINLEPVILTLINAFLVFAIIGFAHVVLMNVIVVYELNVAKVTLYLMGALKLY